MSKTLPCLTTALLLMVLVCGCGLIKGLARVKIEPPASSQDQQAKPESGASTASTDGKATSETGTAISGGIAGGGAAAAGSGEGETTSSAAEQQPTAGGTAPKDTVIVGKLPQPAGGGGGGKSRYVPVGAQRTLTTSDLSGLSGWQLDVLRNEIYAAHGRKFDRADLRAYFRKQSWYVEDSSFTEARLSSLEKRNAAFIASYQKSRGKTSSRRSSSSGSRSGGGFVLSFSSSRTVTSSDLSGLSAWQLDIARNEIYARHGRIFKRSDLRNYFRSQGWYREDSGFSEGRLSSLEKRNAEFIRQYQH